MIGFSGQIPFYPQTPRASMSPASLSHGQDRVTRKTKGDLSRGGKTPAGEVSPQCVRHRS